MLQRIAGENRFTQIGELTFFHRSNRLHSNQGFPIPSIISHHPSNICFLCFVAGCLQELFLEIQTEKKVQEGN
jgi:hypothetical protein